MLASGLRLSYRANRGRFINEEGRHAGEDALVDECSVGVAVLTVPILSGAAAGATDRGPTAVLVDITGGDHARVRHAGV